MGGYGLLKMVKYHSSDLEDFFEGIELEFNKKYRNKAEEIYDASSPEEKEGMNLSKLMASTRMAVDGGKIASSLNAGSRPFTSD